MNKQRIAKQLVGLAKSLKAAYYDPEYMKVIEDIVEDIGADAVEDNVEDSDSYTRTTGTRNQTVEAVGIDYIGTLEGMGAAPAGGSAVDKKMQKLIEDRHEYLSDELRKEYPEQFGDTRGIITYNDAEEAGLEREYEDWEVGLFDENDIIIVEVGASLLGQNECRAYAAVTVGDAQSRYDFLENEDFNFTDANDLRKKLTRALRKVSAKL